MSAAQETQSQDDGSQEARCFIVHGIIVRKRSMGKHLAFADIEVTTRSCGNDDDADADSGVTTGLELDGAGGVSSDLAHQQPNDPNAPTRILKVRCHIQTPSYGAC